MKFLLLISTIIILFENLVSSDPINPAFQSQQKLRSLFTKNSDFVYNLKAQPSSSGPGGEIRIANVDTFPALAGLGVATAVVTIGPCGVNLPHVHQRATELLYVISGRLRVGFVEENGGRAIINDIEAGEVNS
jgi:oxalate decarboxylase/phosphoglucose isomerase-like protein (cupin superfamily)